MSLIHEISPDNGTTKYSIRDDAIAPIELTTTASKPYSVDDQFILDDGKIYKATANIAQDGTITVGTNCEEAGTVSEQLNGKQNILTFDNAPTQNSTNPVKSGGVYNAIDDITGEVTDTDPYTLRQSLGNMADMEIEGASVAWNQLVKPLDANSFTGFRASFSFDNGVATYTATNAGGGVFQINNRMSVLQGHKYLVNFDVNSSTATDKIRCYFQTDGYLVGFKYIQNITGWQNISYIATPNSSISGVYTGCVDQRTSDWAEVKVKNIMVTDLTALFGSPTIADYIYSLEQAQAEAGVAWFRQYYKKLYYAHDPGSIQSVCVGSRKIGSKNVYPVSVEDIISLNTSGTWNGNAYTINGVTFTLQIDEHKITGIKLSGTSSAQALLQFPSVTGLTGEFKQNGGVSSAIYIIAKKNNSWMGKYSESQAQDFDVSLVSTDSYTAFLVVNNAQNTNGHCFYPMLRNAQIADGSFVPYYPSTSYAFDSSKQLRGLFTIANGKLKANGDIYPPSGSITRKYGIVDLGTLYWTYDSANTRFTGLYTLAKNSNRQTKMICPIYTTLDNSEQYDPNWDKVIYKGGDNIVVHDHSYTDAAIFKTAMNGVYVVCELATPTTESANAYQNPQRAYSDGTEEFTDGLTRDVMVPVGHTTTYQKNVTLPPIEDYVDSVAKMAVAPIKCTESTAGDYTLKATVDASGNVTYAWEAVTP